MRKFFDPCVDGVIELIQGQLQQIQKRGRRLRVSETFHSPLTRTDCLEHLPHRRLRRVRIFARRAKRVIETTQIGDEKTRYFVSLLCPTTLGHSNMKISWTAVVRGALIHGIEKSHRSNIVFMRTSPRSLGIVLNEAYFATKYNREDHDIDAVTNNSIAPHQISWLVKKGDLILSNEGRTTEKLFTFPFHENVERKFELPVYEYDLPDQFRSAREGDFPNCSPEYCAIYSDNSRTQDSLRYQLRSVPNPLHEFERAKTPKTKLSYYIADLICRMELSGAEVVVKMTAMKQFLAGLFSRISDAAALFLRGVSISPPVVQMLLYLTICATEPERRSENSFPFSSHTPSQDSGFSELPASLKTGRSI